MEKPTTKTESRAALEDQFILHWGEMGGRWGVNRAIAQIHAILILADTPLHAQEISDRLQLARSNVSTGLRELQTWGLISTTHYKGDRRDHFVAIKDPWEMFSIISNRRFERELEPTITFLQKLSEGGGAETPKVVGDLHSFLKASMSFYRRLSKLPRPLVRQLMKLDSKLTRALDSTE